MEATATTSRLLLETGRVLASLQQRLGSDADFQGLARQLGWDIPTLPAPLASLLPQLAQLDAAVQAVVTDASLRNLAALKTSVTTVFAAIKDLANATYSLPPPYTAADFRAEFPKQLLNALLVEYLQTYHSTLYGLLYGASLITREYVPASGGRLAFVRVSFNLHLLAGLLQDPAAAWRTAYGWGTAFAFDRVAMALGDLTDRLGVPTGYSEADYDLLTTVNPSPIPSAGALPALNALQVSLLHTLTSLGELSLGAQLLPILSPAGVPQGLALAVKAEGTLNETIALGDDFSLTLTGGASLAGGVGVALQPTQPLQLQSLASAGGAVSGRVEAALKRLPTGEAGTPQLLLRTPGNTELTYESITWKAGALASTTAAADLYTEFKINALRFASGEDDNDSFLSQVLKNFYFKTDLSVGLSKARGFYFDSSGGLSTKQIKTIKLGSVQLNNVAFAVATDNTTSFTYLTVVSDLVAELGPLKASMSGVGLKAGIKYDPDGGDIGPFSTDIAVKSPSGIGIAVDSELVTGGGYLFLDPAHHKYAGVANLQVKAGSQEINVNAIGILQTELPNDPTAYSLLLLITATFNPIELGLGFTLSGLGGLVGINRAADTNQLLGLVRAGQLDRLLFTDNVLSDPAAAVALADTNFPAKEGQHIIGLMARLGWGAQSSLITLDVALLVEFPNTVIILLGVLKVALPDENKKLLKLRADFLGSIDFGSKKAAFDASLTDSSILTYSLSGDMAFRLYQGANPLFVITAGGFHPSFQVPAGANLTNLRRITLAFSRGDDLRVALASYFAVTSNTVQFGAHLDLYYRLCRGLHVDGHFGLDVLFQFSPFHLAARVGADVAIKNGNSELLCLHLDLNVDGPGPWHFWGDASFRIWFVRISISFNAFIGQSTTENPGEAPNVHRLLTQALQEPTSWEIEVPQTVSPPGGVVLRPAAGTAGQPLLDPRGTLVLRQHIAPLGVRLDKYGSSRVVPTGGRYFKLSSLTLGAGATAVPYPLTSQPDSPVEETREFFAPDQFTTLTDAQRLSLPSFQLLANGLRLKSLAGLVSTTQVTRRVVEYEQKLLDGTSGGRVKLPAEQFRRLSQGSALGRAVQAELPSARAPQPLGWQESTYAVVNAADLTPYQGHAAFATQLEAEQYRLALVAVTPSLAPELLVVASYELALA